MIVMIAVIVVMNASLPGPGVRADSRTEDLLAVIQPSASSSPALTRGQPEHYSTSVQLNFWEIDPGDRRGLWHCISVAEIRITNRVDLTTGQRL